MKPNQKLLNDIQEKLHHTFYSANIGELNRNEFNIPNPIIILDDSDSTPAVDNENIFNTLGYFSHKTNDSIYLCPKKIEASAKKRAVDGMLLTTIIYIHEAAHYFHFHAREKFNSGDFCNMTTIMAESFAQLLTHRICQKLGDKTLLDLFLRLMDDQPIEYKQYKMPYVIESTIPFNKYRKQEVIDTLLQNFSVESIVKAFVVSPLKEDYNGLIHSVQEEAQNRYLSDKEQELKIAADFGLFGTFSKEDEKFIN